jgi:hypothetical protein
VAKVPSTSASTDIPYTSQNIKAQRKGGLDQKPLETNAKSNGLPLIIDCKQFSWTSRIENGSPGTGTVQLCVKRIRNTNDPCLVSHNYSVTCIVASLTPETDIVK